MNWIEPDWPAPLRVRAISTSRTGGVSIGAFAGLNLAAHVGDDPDCVDRNRALLRERFGLPAEPRWLSQVHGCAVADAGATSRSCEADAAVAFRPGEVCAVMTADCLPLLFCDRAGTRVAAVHAGWRGLAGGVIEAAVERIASPPADLLCWLGPAIGQDAFEVGADVRERFLELGRGGATTAFRPSPGDRWLADLYALATERLHAMDVDQIWGGGFCTYSDPTRFFSYRRDGVTGRMASLIWIEPDNPGDGSRSL